MSHSPSTGPPAAGWPTNTGDRFGWHASTERDDERCRVRKVRVAPGRSRGEEPGVLERGGHNDLAVQLAGLGVPAAC